MKLKKYLNQNNIYYRDAARDLGVTHIYFNTLINGAKPGPKLSLAIHEWSNHKVKLHDLRPDIWPVANKTGKEELVENPAL